MIEDLNMREPVKKKTKKNKQTKNKNTQPCQQLPNHYWHAQRGRGPPIFQVYRSGEMSYSGELRIKLGNQDQDDKN